MPLATGFRIAAFEILPPIRKGGMGEVYRARDTKLDRDVAIKIYRRRSPAIRSAWLVSSAKQGCWPR